MSITYELWDTETRNRVAVFDSREEALAAVRHTARTQGRYLAETLMLGTDNDEGDGEIIARGAGLVALAEGTAAQATNPPALTRTVTRGMVVRQKAASKLREPSSKSKSSKLSPSSSAWAKRNPSGKKGRRR